MLNGAVSSESRPPKDPPPTKDNFIGSPTSPTKSMGAGVENNATNFDEVSLSTAPVPSVQAKDCRKRRVGLTMRDYFSIAILFFVNLLNYADRFTIAGILTSVQKYFDIKDAEAGLLQTIFIIFFMICAPLCGYLGDRFNRKIIMIVGLTIWVLAVLGSSFMPSNAFWAFVLLRGIVGVGEASYSITAPTIIADMFTSVIRSRVLMLFYFAIPVGSGLGFIVGSKVSAALGNDWRWGVRVTPPFGALCILAIALIIKEPERGKAERDQGAEKAQEQLVPSSWWQDLVYLLKNKTYVWATIGYTAVVFVTGTLSWWTSTAIEHARAAERESQNNPTLNTTVSPLTEDEKTNISLLFGVIMTLGGIIGVSLGTVLAQFWKRGQVCFKGRHNPRADPLVCMIGSIVSCPFLFLGMHMITVNMAVSWFAIFLAVTFLCLNWAINVDMLLYIVVPNRRSIATGMQIMISHLCGDASGPYLIGLVSDWIRNGDTSHSAHFRSLLIAFYIPTTLLIVSAIAFGVSAWTLLEDKEKFDIAMGYKTTPGKVTIINGKGTGLENSAFEKSA